MAISVRTRKKEESIGVKIWEISCLLASISGGIVLSIYLCIWIVYKIICWIFS